jgi:hypothetical protein
MGSSRLDNDMAFMRTGSFRLDMKNDMEGTGEGSLLPQMSQTWSTTESLSRAPSLPNEVTDFMNATGMGLTPKGMERKRTKRNESKT